MPEVILHHVLRLPVLWTKRLHLRDVADGIVEARTWKILIGRPIGKVLLLAAIAAARLGTRIGLGLVGDKR